MLPKAYQYKENSGITKKKSRKRRNRNIHIHNWKGDTKEQTWRHKKLDVTAMAPEF